MPNSNKKLIAQIKAKAKTFDEIYEEAKQRILQQAIIHSQKFPNAPYSGHGLITLEKALKAEYARLGIKMQGEFKDALPAIIKGFYEKAKNDIVHDSAYNIIGEIDPKRIEYFMNNTYDSVLGSTSRIAQTHVREIRNIASDVFRQTSLTGETRKQVSKMMLDRAMNIPSFQMLDNMGKKWNAKSYFDMLAHTELMNAGRYSYQCRCEEDGYDVVRLTVSGHSCPYCQVYENRLFSLSGKTPGLPTYDELRSNKVFHPRCTHSFNIVTDFTRERDYNKDGKPKEGYNSTEYKTAAVHMPKTRKLKRVTDSIQYPRKQKDFEKAIVTAKNEHGAIFNAKTGEMMWSKEGSRQNITGIPPKLAKGNILVHNHPKEASFSMQDVDTFMSYGVKEMKVVSSKYAYSLKLRKALKPDDIAKLSNKWYNTYNKLYMRYRNAGIKATKFKASIQHHVNKRVWKNSGVDYVRKDI